jgi:glycine hydroxymethyltransferase
MNKSDMEEIANFIAKLLVEKKDSKKIKEEVIAFRKNFQEVKYCFQTPNKAYDYIRFY